MTHLSFCGHFWNSTNAVKGLRYKNGAKKVSNYDKRFHTIHCIILCLFYAHFLFTYRFIIVYNLLFIEQKLIQIAKNFVMQ